MIVADASIIAKLVLREEGWEKVAELLAREDAVTVDHALKEVLNAIWKAYRLRHLITRDEAEEKRAALERLAGRVVEVEPEERYLPEAFRIALDTGITVYDALYIAQARAKKAKLATSDAKQARIASSLGIDAILIL